MDFELKIALRDSKVATRPYLIVNPSLAKHLPYKASDSLVIFKELAIKISDYCNNKKVLVIGFAETATAIGASVASVLPNSVYVHTTRNLENLKDEQLLVEFLEEHSHAKNQALYLKEQFKDLNIFDAIVFVEDEITTGKTILNFMKRIDFDGEIILSALVFNGLDETRFSDYNAKFICLKKIAYVEELGVHQLSDTRVGVNAQDYHSSVLNIVQQIEKKLRFEDIKNREVLVVGTEEFMYPALILAATLEDKAKNVYTQSTTRSPILPMEKADYPIHSRAEFTSVYEDTRTTYLYNLRHYDTVIVLSNSDRPIVEPLVSKFKEQACSKIYFARIENV